VLKQVQPLFNQAADIWLKKPGI